MVLAGALAMTVNLDGTARLVKRRALKAAEKLLLPAGGFVVVGDSALGAMAQIDD